MNILISGGCKNGKSSHAQELACNLARESTFSEQNTVTTNAAIVNASTATVIASEAKQSHLIYFATMIPHDSEDSERIQKHREERKNLGFTTIECGKDIDKAVKKLEKGSVVLFDSLTALVANEMFDSEITSNTISQSFHARLEKHEEQITQKLQTELEILMNHAESVIFVSDTVFNDGKIYDKTTELYRRILAKTENFIANRCDKVIEMAGKSKIEIENLETKNKNLKTGDRNFQLIVGGAYQGKTAWAKSEFSLSDDEIFVCDKDSFPDFSKRCISHYENYVAYCLKNEIEPKTDFSDCIASESEGRIGGMGEKSPSKIIICDDIFCGVVPVDFFQRKLREKTGLALQKIAESKNIGLTRIFCGIPQRLK